MVTIYAKILHLNFKLYHQEGGDQYGNMCGCVDSTMLYV